MSLLADKIAAEMIQASDLGLDALKKRGQERGVPYEVEDLEATQKFVQELRASPKIRVMPQVYDEAVKIYAAAGQGSAMFDDINLKMVPACQWPGNCWLEWRDEDLWVGFLLRDNQRGIMVSHGCPEGSTVPNWFTRDFSWANGQFGVNLPLKRPLVAANFSREDLDISDREKLQLRGMGVALLILQIIFSMMENKRLIEKQPRIIDEPLQRARVKRGKPRLSDYTEVVIHVTRKEREAREAAAEAIRKGRKLHFVRMFHRVKNGKVERVREHWRGDAGLGRKAKPERYRVSL